MKKPALLLIAALCMLSCDYIFKKHDDGHKSAPAGKSTVLGNDNDKDENGCVTSAGYRWSLLKKECIRPLEVCYRLNTIDEVASESDVKSAFVLFEENSNRAELFLPNDTKSILLKQEDKNGPFKNAHWSLFKQKGYKLQKDGQLLYEGAAAVQEGQVTGDDKEEN